MSPATTPAVAMIANDCSRICSAFFGANASIEGRITAIRSRGNPSHANPAREKTNACASSTYPRRKSHAS